MRKATIVMVILGITLSGLNQAYGNWFTRLLGIEQSGNKGDVRRTR